MTKIKGIDVSKWQSNIDWKKVKASGVKFVMIRALYGTATCSRFHEHIEGATRVGIDIGVYVYSLAKTPQDARLEAQRVLELIKPYEITYPVAYDLEDKNQLGLTTSQRNDLVLAFCGEIEKAGYVPILYTNPNWLNNYLDYNKIKKYDIWLAHYVNKSNYPNPYAMWQYTDKGKVDGINGNVDLNWSYKDYGKEYREMEKLKKENDKLKKEKKELERTVSSLRSKQNQVRVQANKIIKSLEEKNKELDKIIKSAKSMVDYI